ncbi:MAG: hypothetical protein O9246_00555, partial [Brevundimonas sp.]|nr:hypothetical protein [Brevundimonas sp.]
LRPASKRTPSERPKMPMPSWSSAPSQPGKSQQKTLTSRDPVSGEQISADTYLSAVFLAATVTWWIN